jgi:hypothetical protein
LEHRERPDVRAVADLRIAGHGLLGHDVGADDAVDQSRVGADLAPLPHGREALEQGAGKRVTSVPSFTVASM